MSSSSFEVEVEEDRRRKGLVMAWRHDEVDDGEWMLKLWNLWFKEIVEKDSVREIIEASVSRMLIITRSDDDDELSSIVIFDAG